MLQKGMFSSTTNQIEKDGLLLYLDAANIKSYSGSGTDWFDLTSNGNDGTLVGPLFNSNYDGIIDFDGIDDYVTLPVITTSITSVTLQCWVNITLNRNGPFIRLGSGLSDGYSIGIGSVDYDTPGDEIIMLFSGLRWISTSVNFTSGWNLVTMILDSSSEPSVYVNTSFIGSYPGTSPGAPSTNSYIGRNIGDEPGGNRAVDADIANVLIYNKELSITEITKNFNFYSARFGLN